MIEALTGSGLAAAAGLNAYIPMLALGVLARFTGVVALPAGWTWLENGWVLVILGALLVVEVVADKVPAVDHLNDVVQTAVRPAAGGIVFGSGTASETPALSDPGGFLASGGWVPVAIGVVLALTVHLGKAGTRGVANAATVGLAAPVLSTLEDASSVLLVAAAILLPALVAVLLVALVVGLVLLARAAGRGRSRRRDRLAVG